MRAQVARSSSRPSSPALGRLRAAAVVALAAVLGLAAVLAVAAVLGVASDARAYVSSKIPNSSTEIRWSTTTVRYYVQTSGSADVTITQLEAAIAGAFQAWQDVTCSRISFTYGGRRASDPGDGIFIRFQESNWSPTVGDAAAYSTPTRLAGSGELRSTEIVFNGQDVVWTTNAAEADSGFKSDIQGVATHEIGHSLGLDHTRHLPATMFFSSGLGSEMRTLDDDDQRGICYLYPTGSFAQGQPCDSCTATSHCDGGTCIRYDYPNDGVPEYQFCGRNCTATSGCPEGYFCYTQDSLNQCVPDNYYCGDDGGTVPMGDFCYGYSVCESGLRCLATGFGAYCSRECPPACPDGFECMGGYCLQGGDGALGDPCQSSPECASLSCATLAPNHYVCSQDCATDADCPSGFGCAWEMCFRRGAQPFGESCTMHTDCESAYCAGFSSGKYCSDDCRSDGDCPNGSYCTSNDYCSKISIETGDPCANTAECPDGDLCLFAAASDALGVCTKECNPFTGFTCPSGQVCAWVEMSWAETIAGVCKPKNGGPVEGQACDLDGRACEWSAICAAINDVPARCYGHCRKDTGLGCISGERCVVLGEAGSPNHGACYSDPPPPPEDVVQPPPADAVQPPPHDSGGTPPPRDTGGTQPREDTAGTQPGVDTGGSGQPGADGAAPGVDAAGGGGGTGGTGGGSGGSGGSSCSAAPGAPSAPTTALLPVALILLGFALRRRPTPASGRRV